ncbi:MAG: hypothetical protein AAFN81_35490, partial [Bacteroidota bacterium]
MLYSKSCADKAQDEKCSKEEVETHGKSPWYIDLKRIALGDISNHGHGHISRDSHGSSTKT